MTYDVQARADAALASLASLSELIAGMIAEASGDPRPGTT
jgi:hypothetical protein